MNIVEFLEARIAEDEAAANDATGARWVVLPGVHASLVNIDATQIRDEKWKYGRFGHIATTSHDASYAEHIARHGPARVLAECAAKREIIEYVSGWGHEYNDDDTWYSCGLATGHYDDEPGSGCADEAKHGECTCGLRGRQAKILAPLAAVHKDHPDYREEWRHA